MQKGIWSWVAKGVECQRWRRRLRAEACGEVEVRRRYLEEEILLDVGAWLKSLSWSVVYLWNTHQAGWS
jgi:hypothetical protein